MEFWDRVHEQIFQGYSCRRTAHSVTFTAPCTYSPIIQQVENTKKKVMIPIQKFNLGTREFLLLGQGSERAERAESIMILNHSYSTDSHSTYKRCPFLYSVNFPSYIPIAFTALTSNTLNTSRTTLPSPRCLLT